MKINWKTLSKQQAETELENCMHKKSRLFDEQRYIDVELKKGSEAWKKQTEQINFEISQTKGLISKFRKFLK